MGWAALPREPRLNEGTEDPEDTGILNESKTARRALGVKHSPELLLGGGKIAPSPVAVALGMLLVLCSAEAAANPAQQKSCGCLPRAEHSREASSSPAWNRLPFESSGLLADESCFPRCGSMGKGFLRV